MENPLPISENANLASNIPSTGLKPLNAQSAPLITQAEHNRPHYNIDSKRSKLLSKLSTQVSVCNIFSWTTPSSRLLRSPPENRRVASQRSRLNSESVGPNCSCWLLQPTNSCPNKLVRMQTCLTPPPSFLSPTFSPRASALIFAQAKHQAHTSRPPFWSCAADLGDPQETTLANFSRTHLYRSWT